MKFACHLVVYAVILTEALAIILLTFREPEQIAFWMRIMGGALLIGATIVIILAAGTYRSEMRLADMTDDEDNETVTRGRNHDNDHELAPTQDDRHAQGR